MIKMMTINDILVVVVDDDDDYDEGVYAVPLFFNALFKQKSVANGSIVLIESFQYSFLIRFNL